MEFIMRPVTHLRGTAPASLVVVQGMGRALNPTDRSGRPVGRGLSSQGYDRVDAQHNMRLHGGRGWKDVNTFRTEAFDTPVGVTRKNTGWMTVSGGRESLSITFAPDAVVVFALVVKDGMTTEIRNMSLREYQDTYC